MKRLLTLPLLLLFSVSCDVDTGPKCNYQAGWDEGKNERYLSNQEAAELNARCRNARDDYHEDLEKRR